MTVEYEYEYDDGGDDGVMMVVMMVVVMVVVVMMMMIMMIRHNEEMRVPNRRQLRGLALVYKIFTALDRRAASIDVTKPGLWGRSAGDRSATA